MRTTRRWGSSLMELPSTYDIDAITQTTVPSKQQPTAAEVAEAAALAAAEAEVAAASARRAEELYDVSEDSHHCLMLCAIYNQNSFVQYIEPTSQIRIVCRI